MFIAVVAASSDDSSSMVVAFCVGAELDEMSSESSFSWFVSFGSIVGDFKNSFNAASSVNWFDFVVFGMI